ncbi:MAG TPA: NAD(+) synthase [Anaerolineales bacterium]|nr:NAD(+) synthase [Anaerolineales bacterium]HMR98127.1 NAD(+) synthase [Anaerolineales bacterium]HNS61726.1 NAD(+) synthase [Anaerolineales bacterium]
MKLAIAQINTTVGDLEGNVNRILSAAKEVAPQKPDLIVFPELTVCGYPPRDILYDASFVEAVQLATKDLAKQAKGLSPLLVGSFAPADQKMYQHPSLNNIAYLMHNGEMKVAQIKQLLPVYDVFYEPRWFLPGIKTLPPINIAGKKVGVIICEDMWDEEYPIHPGADLKAMGAEMLICISASPYRRGGGEGRLCHAKRQVETRPSSALRSAQDDKMPLVFVNLVGGNDELIFDGGSFVVGGERLKMFEEEVRVIDLNTKDTKGTKEIEGEGEIFKALVLGLRDFADKNNLKHAFVGLSGGIDSSVVAVIAAEALGRERVTGVAIPSRFTDVRSTESARELASRLGIGFEVVELETMHKAAEQAVGPKRSEGVGGENIQARLRMIVLMSFVNQRRGFLINTSNKTELTLGYSTLYGDMAGAISPLGDLTKPDVYALARWINSGLKVGKLQVEGVIPPFVMERKPSAELRENQVDPFDYEKISPEAEALVRNNQSNAAMRTSEHKRWQMGLVLKVSGKSFGRGRLMPITRK